MANFDININVSRETTAEALAFVQKLLGPVAEASGFLGDRIRFYRWQSAMRTIERAERIARELNVAPNPVPLKFLVPFLDDASLEEEDSPLTEAWARLLVAASDEFDTVFQTYADILKKLGPTEVSILDRFYREGDGDLAGEPSSLFLENRRRALDSRLEALLTDGVDRTASDMIECVDQLLKPYFAQPLLVRVDSKGPRLFAPNLRIEAERKHLFVLQNCGLVAFGELNVLSPFVSGSDEMYVEWVQLTEFGFDFIKTCRPPNLIEPTRAASVVARAKQPPEHAFDVMEDSSDDDILASLLNEDR